MRLPHPTRACLACFGLLIAAHLVRADPPPDPLRLVPEQADLVLEVKQPQKLAEILTTLDLLKELKALQQVKEFYDSTNYRRGQQLLAYFEKELGARWPALLDRLAGGGAVLAVKLGPDPAPALLVVQGKDEELTRQFAKLTLQVAEQELARQESKDRPEKGSYRDVATVHIGKQFHAAVAGSALLVSNVEEGLHRALDLYRDGDAKSIAHVAGVADAQRLLPPDPLAFAWLNLDVAHKAPQAKDVFTLPRDNFLLTVAFGGLVDLIGRSPFACAGVYQQGDSYVATIRLPRGRDGSPPGLAVFVPPAGPPASRPLLRPRNVLFSSSYYFDLGKFWEDRTKLFTAKQVQSFEEFDKNSGRFLAANQFSKLLTQSGPYHRLVAVNQDKPGYKTIPKTQIPGFAAVVEMRDPDGFSQGMEAVLRGVALLAGTQARLKLTEEKHGEHLIVGYRFPEDTPLKADVNDIRFNFSPCFVRVGNQFVASSTLELGHELVDLLEQEQKESGTKGSPDSQHNRLYAKGGAQFLGSFQDILLTQAILDQALTPDEAKRQVQALLDLVNRLGVVDLEAGYGAREYHYDVRWTLGK
jgi:hypothetical protein